MTESESKMSKDFQLYSSAYNNIQLNNAGAISKYDSIENEYDALKYGVGVRDALPLGIIEMQGNDTLDFLHRVSTNSSKDLRPFNSIKTIFTNEKGRIIDRVDVVNIEKSVLLICHRLLKSKLFFWINKYIIMEDIKTSDESDNYFIYDFYGSQVVSFLKMFFGDIVENILGNEYSKVNLEERDFLLARLSETGQVFYRVIGSSHNKEFFFKYLDENKSVFDFSMVGEDAYNVFRVENGIPGCPNELNDSVNPYEANVISDVSFTKGCYIGQEVIARLDTFDKVQKKLKGIIFDDKYEGVTPAVLLSQDGQEAGTLTSAVYSFMLKKNIGLAIIKISYGEAGTLLHLKDKNNSTLTVTNLPFRK